MTHHDQAANAVSVHDEHVYRLVSTSHVVQSPVNNCKYFLESVVAFTASQAVDTGHCAKLFCVSVHKAAGQAHTDNRRRPVPTAGRSTQGDRAPRVGAGGGRVSSRATPSATHNTFIAEADARRREIKCV